MQVTKTTQKPSFEPITISIVIESKKEYDVMVVMSKLNVSIPDLFIDEKRPFIKSFLNALGKALNIKYK